MSTRNSCSDQQLSNSKSFFIFQGHGENVSDGFLGQPFPDCTMINDTGQEVRLSEQWKDGRVLLLFYSSAFGFVCNLEMLTFTAMIKAFKEANCRVFGVSNDTQRSMGAYSENLKIGFPLLSDEGSRLARTFGAMESDDGPWPGFIKRSEFLIDRQGIIRYVHIPPDSNWEPDYDMILAEARKLAGED
jgi:glutaredoxin-dependent peroxiredoxin